MNYFIIAGEASGDVHAAVLINEIRALDPDARITGLGGDRMVSAGCVLHQHISKMAFMGFAAVLANLGQIRQNFRIAKQALLDERPDALILIDYPSFNLKMAAFCRKHLPATKIYYYIPPKIWAWKKRRIHSIARLCDEVLGIFPFEPAFYAKYGYYCTYVGNPTAEEVGRLQTDNQSVRPQAGLSAKRSVLCQRSGLSLALLPGSRPTEISKCLERMLEIGRLYPDYERVVCAAPGIDDSFYTPYLREGETLTRDTYAAVRAAKAAIVNSGTATLETALLNCPQVAVYQLAVPRIVGLIRWAAQPLMFSIPYFTLVNIIAGKQVIKEYIANEFTIENVSQELNRLLTDDAYTKNMLDQYEHIRSMLGTEPAAKRAAQIITSKS